MAIGVDIAAASSSPGSPFTPQSVTNTSPICPAIAPSGIPKFIPIPASIGMIRDNTKNVLLTILLPSSCETNDI